MHTERDDLADWIDRLRVGIRRGELRDRPPVKVGPVMMGAEQAARILLADLDRHDRFLARHGGDVSMTARRQHLLDQLRRLREQIG